MRAIFIYNLISFGFHATTDHHDTRSTHRQLSPSEFVVQKRKRALIHPTAFRKQIVFERQATTHAIHSKWMEPNFPGRKNRFELIRNRWRTFRKLLRTHVAVLLAVAWNCVYPLNPAELCSALLRRKKRISLEMNVHRQSARTTTHSKQLWIVYRERSMHFESLFDSELISLNHFSQNRMNVVLFASIVNSEPCNRIY